MRKITFCTDEYYHAYNRGADKRIVFQDMRDHERFAYLLYACNDTSPLLNSQFYYRGLASIVNKDKDKRERLVDIVSFCLMPNHFHLLLKQLCDNGIPRFMHKLGTGYTMYFNTRYKHSGVIFQGTYKAIHIDEERYLTHLTRYIHLNPLELKDPEWKKQGVKDWDDANQYLKNFRWSSYSDYLGDNKFKPILNLELMTEIFKKPQEYEDFMKIWIPQDFKQIEPNILL